MVVIHNKPRNCLGSCVFVLVLCLLLPCQGAFYDNPQQDPLPSGPNADEELRRKWDNEVGRFCCLVVIPLREVHQHIYRSGASPAYPLLHTSSTSNA